MVEEGKDRMTVFEQEISNGAGRESLPACTVLYTGSDSGQGGENLSLSCSTIFSIKDAASPVKDNLFPVEIIVS